MKKLICLCTLIFLISSSNYVTAQSLSIEETKEKLCGNKWFLRRLEQDGRYFTAPKEIQGLKMVFKPNGTMYSYLPGTKESDAEIWRWSITKSVLTIIKPSGKEVNKYRLEDFIGYKLYLTDNEDDEMPTFVFEIAEKTVTAETVTPKEKGAIGKQVWSTENLDTDKFKNGDVIPEAKTAEEWVRAAKNGQPAWCSYEGRTGFGKLYNWYAVNDPRGLAPKGWHIPTKAEVETLVSYLGGKDEAAKKMKKPDLWIEKGGSDNSSGFSALPGGSRGSDGKFWNASLTGYFWTTTLSSDEIRPVIKYGMSTGPLGFFLAFFGEGCAVRCIKN